MNSVQFQKKVSHEHEEKNTHSDKKMVKKMLSQKKKKMQIPVKEKLCNISRNETIAVL